MAAAVGGFDEVAQQQLGDEILRQLEQCHHEKPPREVYQVQYTLMKEGNLLAPHHVWIGPGQWTRRPEVQVLNRVDEKHACLKWLLQHNNPGGNNNNNGLLLELIRGVNRELERINHRCEGLQRKELVKRMLLDGCYIIYKFAKTPLKKDNNRPGREVHLNTNCIMEQLGRKVHLITNCIMDRIRGVHNNSNNHNNSSSRDLEAGGLEMQQPGGESAQAAAAAAAAAAATTDERRQQPQTAQEEQDREALARWLEFRDCWCLTDNCVPYGVLDVINRRVYGVPEGRFGGATARILLQSCSMYYYVPPPPSPNPVHIIVPSETMPAGDNANCLLILLAQLLRPRRRRDSSLLNSTCQPQQQEAAAEPLLRRRRRLRATEYVRRCNARFVAPPLDAEERRCVLDVTATVRGRFRSIDVQVPTLNVDGATLALLRNLVALEQRGITPDHYVTAYCFFMHRIASTAEDVELLKSEGVIYYEYSDPMEVATGFKEVVQITQVISDADNYLLPIEQELRRRYDSTFHRCLSWFRVSYWTKSKVLTRITFLLGVLGVPGLVYTALSYYHKA